VSHWEDRAIDAALHEVHGTAPPDLSARVVAALGQHAGGPLPRLEPVRTSRWHLAAVLLGASLLGVAAAALASLLLSHAVSPSPAVSVGLRVLDGVVVCVEAGRERTVVPGATAPAPFVAVPGNRLRTPGPSVFVFDSFGRLDTGPHTELEVRSMEFTRKHGVLAASSLTLGIVTGAVTWHALTRHETVRAGGELRVHGDTDADGAAMLAELQRLREQNASLQQERESLLAAVAQREPAPAAPQPAAEPVAPPPPAAPEKAALAFSDPRCAEALAKIDWAKVGAVTKEMGPLLAQLAVAMSQEGVEMPVDLAVKVGELNTALVGQVPAMLETGLPGFGPNGTFTHPLVAANMLASTLAASGQQLTAAQQQQIDGLVRAFSVEAQSVADTQGEFALEQLYAETTMKDRFYEQVGSLLSPDQHGAVFPDGPTKYEGANLFDTGVLLRNHAQPVPAKDAAEFARIVSRRIEEKLGLDEASTAQVRALLARTASDPELWRDPANAKERLPGHFLKAGRTRTALRSQLEWMRQIQAQVALTPEQRKELAKMAHVLVPLPR
jgi:hypothetical protein